MWAISRLTRDARACRLVRWCSRRRSSRRVVKVRDAYFRASFARAFGDGDASQVGARAR